MTLCHILPERRGWVNRIKLQDWSITIRWFCVISRTFVVGGNLSLCRDAVSIFYSPSQLGSLTLVGEWASQIESLASRVFHCMDQFMWLGRVVIVILVEAANHACREALEGSPRRFYYLLGGARFITWHLRVQSIFSNAECVWATALHPNPPYKRTCAALIQLVGHMSNTNIGWTISLKRKTPNSKTKNLKLDSDVVFIDAQLYCNLLFSCNIDVGKRDNCCMGNCWSSIQPFLTPLQDPSTDTQFCETAELLPSWLGLSNTPTTSLQTLPPISVLDMTLNNLMVRFQWFWSFGECKTPIHCHCSQVQSGPEW